MFYAILLVTHDVMFNNNHWENVKDSSCAEFLLVENTLYSTIFRAHFAHCHEPTPLILQQTFKLKPNKEDKMGVVSYVYIIFVHIFLTQSLKKLASFVTFGGVFFPCLKFQARWLYEEAIKFNPYSAVLWKEVSHMSPINILRFTCFIYLVIANSFSWFLLLFFFFHILLIFENVSKLCFWMVFFLFLFLCNDSTLASRLFTRATRKNWKKH